MKLSHDLGYIFKTVFNRRNVNNLASKTGFVKRKSKLTGYDFLLSLSVGRLKK